MSSTTTPNLGLYKETPGTQEPADMLKYNANFDTLDNAVTLTGSQTLTNKTLTSPTMTGAVVSSGGLQVTAGNIGIGTAPQAGSTAAGITIAAVTSGASANYGIFINPPSGGSGNNAAVAAFGYSIFANAVGNTNAASGLIRMPNAQYLGWRNAANSGDDILGFDASDRLVVTGIASAASATGGAASLPANPVGFLRIFSGSTEFKVPYYSA